jgi:hypothetical protein
MLSALETPSAYVSSQPTIEPHGASTHPNFSHDWSAVDTFHAQQAGTVAIELLYLDECGMVAQLVSFAFQSRN